MVADAGERLADLARDFGRKISSGPIGLNVRVGDPTTEVGREAVACGADLIIMSTHGYTGLKRVLFGGITDSVVRCSPCPVLVVRSHPPESAAHRSSPAHELRRLLVPMDFSARAERAIRYAVALAGQAGSAVSLVHVMAEVKQNDAAVLTGGHSTLSADAGKQLHSVMDEVVDPDLRGEVYLRCGAPFQHIIAVADSHEVDLLVLTTHGRTGLSHLLMGSTAERVIYHASCPVLIIRTA
jgi:nucleotide-binding universal stress UspA family protein